MAHLSDNGVPRALRVAGEADEHEAEPLGLGRARTRLQKKMSRERGNESERGLRGKAARVDNRRRG